MRFRTEIEINPFEPKVNYSSRVVTFGSCFAEVIGERLKRSKFNTVVNPFGAQFNPISIAQSIGRIGAMELISTDQIEQGSDVLFHYDFHSMFNCSDREVMSNRINQTIASSHHALREADWVILTLGTAYVYELKERCRIVANCHKQHPKLFIRRRVSVDEIVDRLSQLIENELSGKRVIITLSPIRHIADGLAENSLSKATLRVAIDELISKYDKLHYFPAYEIMMDDLRDYRFYDNDMLHISNMAKEYIWEHFCSTALSAESLRCMSQVEKIIQATEHRPRDPFSDGYKTFCQQQLKKIESLKEVDLSIETEYFKKRIDG
ncbi:MAG: GSCFA domain-containing protein [Rikenellaceae bacterium]